MRIDLLEAFGLEPMIINVLKCKYGAALLPIQEQAFKKYQILKGGNFLVSAVTFSAKNLVGEILALHYGSKDKRAFYLVPTKALAEEKFEQFCDDYKKAGIQTVISTHDRQEYDERIEGCRFHIAIIVYEKLHSLLVGNPNLLNNIGLVLVDEMQYLAKEEHGPALEILLTRILLNPKQPQLVGLSAVLGKSESLAQWLRAKMIQEDKRLVELRQGVLFEGKFHYREFNSGIVGQEEWFSVKSAAGTALYVETAKFLVEDMNEQTIIFLPDKPATEALAYRLSDALNLPDAAGALAEMSTLEESVSRDMLLTLLKNGVAIYNDDLSGDERDVVERYTRKGEIHVICAPATLVEGLNLPMKNAIIAPMHCKYFRDTLSLFKGRILVSDYENMGGHFAHCGFATDFCRVVFVTTSSVDYKFYEDHFIKGPVEEMSPALHRKEMDCHILNLIASGICGDAREIKIFLKNTFTGWTLWNTEMADTDYDKVIADTIALSVKWGLIEKTAKDGLILTPLGKNNVAKGIALHTAVSFHEFINHADPRSVSDFQILMLLAMSHDATPFYMPLRRDDRLYDDYIDELKQVIQDSMEEAKPVVQSIWKIMGMLSQEKERAVKKALMMNRWVSEAKTKEIENSYVIFNGVMKRVSEDFSWLAETLAFLTTEIRWDMLAINRMNNRPRRLSYDVTEKGIVLSNMRLRGLGRAHINRLIAEGYDTPEAIADMLFAELERFLPKRQAERLYRHFHRDYPDIGDVTEQGTITGVSESVGFDYVSGMANRISEGTGGKPLVKAGSLAPTTTATTTITTTITTKTASRPSEISFPCHLADILRNKSLLFALRTRLTDTKNLRELITDPPDIFIDEHQQLFFYRGIPIKLQPACFHYLLLLAEKPKQIVARDEIYHRLWPGPMNYDGSNKPYDRQISDHKRRCMAQIKKGVTSKIDMVPGELEALIVTRPKVGYMLNLGQQDVLILKAQ